MFTTGRARRRGGEMGMGGSWLARHTVGTDGWKELNGYFKIAIGGIWNIPNTKKL